MNAIIFIERRCAYDDTGAFELCDDVFHELIDAGPQAAQEMWETHLDVAWELEGQRDGLER